MRIAFYIAEKDRNWGLAEALEAGAKVHGDTVEIIDQRQFSGVRDDFDAGACLGVKRAGKRLLTAHLQAGKHFLFFDKGHIRRKNYIRVAVDSWQPLAYFQSSARPPDRFDRLELKLDRRRKSEPAHPILFAGSSQKYCNFHDLGPATRYAERVTRRLRKSSRREVVYRPKPSWAANHPEECAPIDGTRYSPPSMSIAAELKRCHLLVTHGSNAAFDALLAGVPVMTLGEGICRPVTMGESWDSLETPMWPSDEARHQFFCDVAYCQWTAEEFRSGEAWHHLRATLQSLPPPGGASDGSGLDALIAQYAEMHRQPKYFRGRGTMKYLAKVGRLILQHEAATLLDYGSGKGEQYEPPMNLHEAWAVAVTCYDPAVPHFAKMPEGQFDGVLCCDVMEHIPEPHVPAILHDVMARARRFAFFAIATTPASKTLPDGRNCHLTIRPEEWWRKQLEQARQAAAPDLAVIAEIQPDPPIAPMLPEED